MSFLSSALGLTLDGNRNRVDQATAGVLKNVDATPRRLKAPQVLH